jgi:glycosyltransferase involved in cell wall biosynthesis
VSLKVGFLAPEGEVLPYYAARLKALSEVAGIEVVVYVDKAIHPNAIEGLEESPGAVRVVRISHLRVPSHRRAKDLGYTVSVRRGIPCSIAFHCIGDRLDILVVCNATQMLLAKAAAVFGGVSLALIVEDTLHATRLMPSWLKRIKAVAYRMSDSAFAFSEEAKAFLASIGYRREIFRTSWSLDFEAFRRAVTASTNRPSVREAEGVKFLFLGRLVPLKGIVELLDAWQHCSASFHGRASLRIVGGGPLAETLQATIRSRMLRNVELVGPVPYTGAIAELASSDCLILPTLQDLFSLVVLEAMAAGRAVITTRYNGACELVRNWDAGWVVDSVDRGTLVAVLEEAAQDRARLRAIGKRNAEAAKQYDNAVVMQAFSRALIAMREDKGQALPRIVDE